MSRMFALTLFTLISTTSTAPRASETKPPSPAVAAAQSAVQETLLQPLTRKEVNRKKFSRAVRPAVARRLRILDEASRTDDNGAAFMTFAIDARHGLVFRDGSQDDWHMGDITGCVYLDSQEVFVARGKAHYPAGLLLGKRVKAAPLHVCQAASTPIAQAR